jgi:hypothetical protein
LAHDQGDLAQARAYAEVVLETIAIHPPVGLGEPFSVYLTCYQILAANGDPRAGSVLCAALRLLHAYADHIADDALRLSFLENVATHRELLRAGRGAAPGQATPEQAASGAQEPATRPDTARPRPISAENS